MIPVLRYRLTAPLLSVVLTCASCMHPTPDWPDTDPIAPNVVLWNGTSWEALGDGLDSLVAAVAFSPDGILYAGGNFLRSGQRDCPHVARWDAAQRQWMPIGKGVNGYVGAIAFDGEMVYVGGDFSEAYNADGSVIRTQHLARWDGERWSAVYGVDQVIIELKATHGVVFAGSHFDLYEIDPATSTSKVITRLDRGANGLVVVGDTLFIGGMFHSPPNTPPAGVLKLNLIDKTVHLTKYLASWELPRGFVSDLAAIDSVLYMGGSFSFDDQYRFSAVNLRTGRHASLPWVDGRIIALAADGRYIYAGGEFMRLHDGSDLFRVGRYHVRTDRWEPLGKGLGGYIYDIAARQGVVAFAGEIGGTVR